MDLRKHFSARKTQLGAEFRRQNSGKKLIEEISAKTPFSSTPVPRTASQLKNSPSQLKTDASEEGKPDLLSRLAASARKSEKNLEKNSAKTFHEFFRDPKRLESRNRVIQDFTAGVTALQRTPEKLQLSPYYSPHKTCLTNSQGRINLGLSHVRKQLFSKPSTLPASGTSPVKTQEVTNEASTSKDTTNSRTEEEIFQETSKSINQSNQSTNQPTEQTNKSTNQPIKTPIKNVEFSSNHLRSPGKRMLLFSPSKGFLPTCVATASSVHAEAVCQGVPSAVDAKDAYSIRLAEENSSLKRKAEFDRSDVKKRLEFSKVLRTGLANSLQSHAGLYQISERISEKPAATRFASLIEKSEKLPLPSHFKTLEDLFAKLDSVISINHRQTSYFEKFRDSSGIFEILSRPLEYKDLGQIKAIFAEAFIFRVEKPASHLASPGLDSISAEKEHLAIFLRDDTKTETEIFLTKLLSEDLVRRRKKFHENLLKIVFEEHRKFLSSLQPAIQIEDEKITKWHPNFPLEETKFPDPVDLPQFSRPKIGRTATEVFSLRKKFPLNGNPLDGNHVVGNPLSGNDVNGGPLGGNSVSGGPLGGSLVSGGPLGGVSSTNSEPSSSSSVTSQSSLDSPVLSRALRKVDPAFLARIKANQARKNANLMTRDPQIEKKLKMLERIPMMARIILNHFSSMQKTTLEVSTVMNALRISMTTKLTTEEFQEHMDFLTEIFSKNWLQHVHLKRGLFLMIHDATVGLKEIDDVVQKEMDRLKKL